MAQYITLARCDDILSASGETGWFNYRDTEKTGFIVRASDRIESLPFKLDATESSSFPDNVPNRYFSRPRFNEGFYSFFDDDGGLTSPSTDSDHTQEPIPADLELAVARLALHYARNPLSSYYDTSVATTPETSIGAGLDDLPLEVQTALYPYLTDALRGEESGDTSVGRLEETLSQAVSLHYDGDLPRATQTIPQASTQPSTGSTVTAEVTSDSIIAAVSGDPTDDQIIQYDQASNTLEFTNLPVPSSTVVSGDTTVVANPTVDSSDPVLNSLKVGTTDYRVVGQKGDKGDPGDTGAAGRDGRDGSDGRDGTDATVNATNMINAVSGTPSLGRVMTWSDRATLTWAAQSGGGGGGGTVTAQDIIDAIDAEPRPKVDSVIGVGGTSDTLRWVSNVDVSAAAVAEVVTGTKSEGNYIAYDQLDSGLDSLKWVTPPSPPVSGTIPYLTVDPAFFADEAVEQSFRLTLHGVDDVPALSTVTKVKISFGFGAVNIPERSFDIPDGTTRVQLVTITSAQAQTILNNQFVKRDRSVAVSASIEDASNVQKSSLDASLGLVSQDKIPAIRSELTTPVPYITGDPHYWVNTGEARVLSLVLHDIDITRANHDVNSLRIAVSGNGFTMVWPIATASRRVNIAISANQANNITTNIGRGNDTVTLGVELRKDTTIRQSFSGSLPVVVTGKTIALMEDIPSISVTRQNSSTTPPTIQRISINGTEYQV